MTLARPTIATLGFIACLTAITAACGARTTPPAQSPSAPSAPEPTPTAPPPTPTPDPIREPRSVDCELIAEAGKPIATVALTERVDPSNAPYPSNESERLLFRQVYETLVHVDCKGRVVPGLASSWRLDKSARVWLVTLRENAQFSDHTPVTATEVRASWMPDGIDDQLRPQVSRLVESVAVIDDRTLAITLRSQRADAPLALAHPDLAIAKRASDAPWPLGTRIDRAMLARDADSTILVERDGMPSIRFLAASGDQRDVLDKGVDLLVTRDPAALDYAGTLPQFQSVPLDWQRTHVLLTPGRAGTAPSLSEQSRHALAGDAVRGEARTASGPFWWQTLPCDVVSLPRPAPSSSAARIVHDASDAVARDLAERLVGLRLYKSAVALTGEPLATARRRGSDAGYIMSFDRRPVDPCRDIRAVMDTIGWLDPTTILPLVETRLHAIVRRGQSGLMADWDGGLLIAGGAPDKQ